MSLIVIRVNRKVKISVKGATATAQQTNNSSLFLDRKIDEVTAGLRRGYSRLLYNISDEKCTVYPRLHFGYEDRGKPITQLQKRPPSLIF